MASTTETGHAKNVANFESLISFCVGYGVIYNPSKASMKLTALSALFTSAKSVLAVVNTVLPIYRNAINAREAVFSPLSKLITRVINAAASSNVSESVLVDIKSIARKIQGVRVSDKLPAVVDNPATPVDESQKSSSASQMGFDNRIENTDKLINILLTQPGYAPNEIDLKVATLAALLAEMRIRNTAAINALTPLSNARISRNAVLYSPRTGLVDIAGEVKSYIKSVFGVTDPRYRQVGGLRFVRFRQ